MPIKIYKTQTFNKIFLCFETKHKKHKTQTQIFVFHAHHKTRNQHTPQTHKLRSTKLTTYKPISTQLTTYKPTVRIHISTTICTTELRDREMKEKDLPIWDRETMICELERV